MGRKWFNLDALAAIVEHVSTVVFAMAAFWLTGQALAYLIPSVTMRQVIEWVDNFVLAGLVVILGIKLLVFAARGIGHGPHILLA
jgi:hypothetical protein